VKVEAAMVLKIVRAVSGLTWDCEPTARSYRVSNETVIRASGMLRAGKTQSELRRYKRMRYRVSQLIVRHCNPARLDDYCNF
jgi:hypothetical protein